MKLFTHIANLAFVEVHRDFGEGLEVRRATSDEVASLRDLVSSELMVHLPGGRLLGLERNPYETVPHRHEPKPNTASFSTTDLPEEQWRYNVIAFEGGTNTPIHNLVEASLLTRKRLLLGPTLIDGGSGGVISYAGFGRFLKEVRTSDDPFLSLETADLDDLQNVYRRIFIEMERDYDILRDAMRRFEQLDAIAKESPLRFLGYVAILESLITHMPDPKDPYDSLTRQVRKKMVLIGRRSVIALPYDVFDGNTPPDTLWKRLYEYRSKIAHGATVEFSGRLACLKSPEAAVEFIIGATAAVMRQVLEEPDLIADLRDC